MDNKNHSHKLKCSVSGVTQKHSQAARTDSQQFRCKPQNADCLKQSLGSKKCDYGHQPTPKRTATTPEADAGTVPLGCF